MLKTNKQKTQTLVREIAYRAKALAPQLANVISIFKNLVVEEKQKEQNPKTIPRCSCVFTCGAHTCTYKHKCEKCNSCMLLVV